MSKELEGDALDEAVTQAEADATGKPRSWRHYSCMWSAAGPIIERERIWLTAWPDGKSWSADVPGEPGDPHHPSPDDAPFGSPGVVVGTGFGPTPLIAAMRAFVHAIQVRKAKLQRAIEAQLDAPEAK